MNLDFRFYRYKDVEDFWTACASVNQRMQYTNIKSLFWYESKNFLLCVILSSVVFYGRIYFRGWTWRNAVYWNMKILNLNTKQIQISFKNQCTDSFLCLWLCIHNSFPYQRVCLSLSLPPESYLFTFWFGAQSGSGLAMSVKTAQLIEVFDIVKVCLDLHIDRAF